MLNSQKFYIKSGLVDTLELTIKRYFNFHNHVSLAYRCNNPGKLTILNDALNYHALKTVYGIYFFQTKEEGIKALRRKIKDAIERGWTIKQLLIYNYDEKDIKNLLKILPFEANKTLKSYIRD